MLGECAWHKAFNIEWRPARLPGREDAPGVEVKGTRWPHGGLPVQRDADPKWLCLPHVLVTMTEVPGGLHCVLRDVWEIAPANFLESDYGGPLAANNPHPDLFGTWPYR